MVSPELQTRLVESARETLGVPWMHMGRWKINGHPGIDCAGLLAWMFYRLEIEYIDHKGRYSPFPDGHTLINLIRKNAVVEIDPADAGPGTIIIFCMSRKPGGDERPMHCAVLSGLNPRYMIHAINKRGVMKSCENRVIDRIWENVTHAFDFDERRVG